MKTVLLGITGCIAAYKACYIVRGLQKAGVRVKVVMTEHATHFVGPTTFRALTNEEVAVKLFDEPGDPIHHISLAREADLFCIAPATANVCAKIANGTADDLLTTTALATPAPLVVAPAMNDGMWASPVTQENIAALEARGVRVVYPSSGHLACGTEGKGRMEEPEEIVRHLELFFARRDGDLRGQHVLITAGPTFEKMDPVRFIGNYSSGKMGFALADECTARGAEVTLIAGPVERQTYLPPTRRINVESAQQMYEAAMEWFPRSQAAILCAAVADYTPETVADEKIKRERTGEMTLQLKPTQDIAAALGRIKNPGQLLVGFALETCRAREHAQEKLTRKRLDFIVLNSLEDKGAGFRCDTNKISLIDADSQRDFPLKSKEEVARDIVDEMARRIK